MAAVVGLVIALVLVRATSNGSRAGAAPFGSVAASGSTPAVPSLQKQVAALVPAGLTVGVSVLDLTAGTRFGYGEQRGMIAASISKLDVLEVVLLTHEDEHTPLDADAAADATAMIEQSDNDAGQDLWDAVGGAPAVAAANLRLGLTATVPDPDGYYGLSTTGATDQTELLRDLLDAGPLDSGSRAYALGLLRNVDSDEAWGATAAADAGTTSAVKNGWLPIDSQDDRWVVNSDAIVTAHGHQLLISIMTDGEATEQPGIDLIESIARAVSAHVRLSG